MGPRGALWEIWEVGNNGSETLAEEQGSSEESKGCPFDHLSQPRLFIWWIMYHLVYIWWSVGFLALDAKKTKQTPKSSLRTASQLRRTMFLWKTGPLHLKCKPGDAEGGGDCIWLWNTRWMLVRDVESGISFSGYSGEENCKRTANPSTLFQVGVANPRVAYLLIYWVHVSGYLSVALPAKRSSV